MNTRTTIKSKMFFVHGSNLNKPFCPSLGLLRPCRQSGLRPGWRYLLSLPSFRPTLFRTWRHVNILSKQLRLPLRNSVSGEISSEHRHPNVNIVIRTSSEWWDFVWIWRHVYFTNQSLVPSVPGTGWKKRTLTFTPSRLSTHGKSTMCRLRYLYYVK